MHHRERTLDEAPGSVQAAMPHPDHPLACRLRCRRHRFQLAFAQDVQAGLDSRDHGVKLEGTGTGLCVIARNERDLAAFVAAVRSRWDPGVEVEGPSVRLWPGTPVREPVMRILVLAPRPMAALVRHALNQRGAHAVEIEWGHETSTIAGEAPMRQLLGFAAWLDASSSAKAQVVTSLSHYAPVDDEPDPWAA